MVNQASATALNLRKFLTFQICNGTSAMIEAESVLATLQVPRDHILGIFAMPEWVIGVYNWHGEILWCIDLPHYLQLDPASLTASPVLSVLITECDGQRLGIAVAHVEDLATYTSEDLASAPVVFPTLAAIVQGAVVAETLLLWLKVSALYERIRDHIHNLSWI